MNTTALLFAMPLVLGVDPGRLQPSPAPAPYPDASCGTRGAVGPLPQTFCGAKTFADPLTAVSVDAGQLATNLITGSNLNQSIVIVGSVSAGNNNADLVLKGSAIRTQGNYFELQTPNGSSLLAYVDRSGNIATNGTFLGGIWQSLPFGGGSTIITTRGADDPSPGLTIEPINAPSSLGGPLLQISRNFVGTPAFRVDRWGEVFSDTVSNVGSSAFIDSSGESGHVSLSCSNGLYTVIAGRLPSAYYGHHGGVTVVAANPMSAGFIMELNNPLTSGSTDKKVMWNYQGGATQYFAGYSESQFAICLNADPAPSDGGTVAADAGFAFEGTEMWAVDKHRKCVCRPDLGDGGAQGTTGDGWVRVKDELPCSL